MFKISIKNPFLKNQVFYQFALSKIVCNFKNSAQILKRNHILLKKLDVKNCSWYSKLGSAYIKKSSLYTNKLYILY